MKHLRPSMIAVATCAALVTLATTTAYAVPLDNAFVVQPYLDTSLPGTTVAARPELAGVVLADTMQPFTFSGMALSGTVQNRVVREAGTGTLDFYWRVLVDPASTGGGISAFRLGNFGYSYLTDADWRLDGLGTVAPFVGRLFNPSGRPDGAINFLFTDPQVGPSDLTTGVGGSRFFFLHTDATAYAMTASYDLLGGPNQTLSGSYATYAPALSVPEPASALLMALGLPALAFLLRRRTRA